MIQVRRLTKAYDDLRRGRVEAVRGVDFHCRDGEIFGLLGPNGAGKTTILRILATILRPTGGTAHVDGHDVALQPDAVRKRIGFVSASTALYERMSAWETVEHFGQLHGLARDVLRGRMEELFDRLQMNAFRDVQGGKLSTGMKQKVLIARALVHDPPVLIFDEPTTGLDVLVSRALLRAILELRERGKCILFSTHVMREAEKLCDRVAIMHAGRILTLGTLNELRDRHGENDLEDLFFRLLASDRNRAADEEIQELASRERVA